MSQESLFPTHPILKEKTQLDLKTEAETLSVSEISQKLKQTVEVNFADIRIRGEVSQPKYHGSGHLYCRLKDEGAVIDAVCWRGTVSKLPFKFEDGMEVICRGRLTTYPGRSQYQIVIESAELAGEGALLKMIEMRKQSLIKEGLFDVSRKKPLPFLPKVIGIVTSPTGAVIQDILHRLQDRFPTEVLLWPVAVQGIGSELQIAEAITGFNTFYMQGLPKPDLVIVARGGGSLEDLMPFNEEIVVRAVAESEIPIISAIGHETDTTLIDFASDQRAPTPTAAAEMAVPVKEELSLALQSHYQSMRTNMYRFLVEKRNYIEALSKGIKNPQYILDQLVQKSDDWAERLKLAMATLLEQKTSKLDKSSMLLSVEPYLYRVSQSKKEISNYQTQLSYHISTLLKDAQQKLGYQKQLLESYSYRNVLKRGYAMVKEGRRLIGSAVDAKTAKKLSIQFHDGEIQVSKDQDNHSEQTDLFD